MVGRASPRSLPIRLLTSPHDAIISNRWRSPQANFNTRCDGTNAIVNWYLFGSSTNPSVIVGRHGRLFLSDGEVPNRVILGDCGAWWSEGYLASFAHDAQAAVERLQHDFGSLSGLFVPTSAVLYPENLPLWMANACAHRVPLVDDILARLPQSQQRLLAYPKALAASLPPSAPLIPKRNFHWDGQGVSLFMEAYVESRFGLTREAMPIWRPASKPSDIARFLPGVSLANQINIADWTVSAVLTAPSLITCEVADSDL